ncbi:hypothetical protein EAE96_003559 [Botrytis aclada]|nr:hypothetical protein EAE96_003559 [Botrytis aclada]
MPRFFRADRGTELPLVAEAHFALSRKVDESVKEIKDCFWFGKSTKNQRIESWWQELQISLLYRWRNYFEELVKNNQFHKDKRGDQIAILVIYMKWIREEVMGYADLWNVYNIRKDKTHPHHCAGKPFMMYQFPQEGYTDKGRTVLSELCEKLLTDCEEWDINEYLPPDTIEFCQDFVQSLGYDLNTMKPSDTTGQGELVHVLVYHSLRKYLQRHIDSNREPFLYSSLVPTDGYNGIIKRGGAISEMVCDNLSFVQAQRRYTDEIAMNRGVDHLIRDEPNIEIGDDKVIDWGWTE